MGKSKKNIPSLEDALKTFTTDRLLPIYLFFGTDHFAIESTLQFLETAASPLIGSEFDNETIYGEDKTALDIINLASTFPFGSDKKLLIVKDFDKIRDKKAFLSYVKSPAPFTILVLLCGEIASTDTEPYNSMTMAGYIFEAKELKGERLTDWIVSEAARNGKQLSRDNAYLLMDIAGENRDAVEAQLQKIYTFLEDKIEINHQVIRDLSASLKEYTIFDLQNSLGKKDKTASVKTAFNLLEKGNDLSMILYMLTRYFTALSRVKELNEQNTDQYTAARALGISPFFYKDYISARKLYSDNDILRAVRALFDAELSYKTTQVEPKTILTILLGEILNF